VANEASSAMGNPARGAELYGNCVPCHQLEGKGVAGLPVENGRELAVASDPATFTAAIVRLLEEPELRASTGERALRLVKERYDNTVITARLLEFYKKLRHGS